MVGTTTSWQGYNESGLAEAVALFEPTSLLHTRGTMMRCYMYRIQDGCRATRNLKTIPTTSRIFEIRVGVGDGLASGDEAWPRQFCWTLCTRDAELLPHCVPLDWKALRKATGALRGCKLRNGAFPWTDALLCASVSQPWLCLIISAESSLKCCGPATSVWWMVPK